MDDSRRIASPPSMTSLATDALRRMILSGELRTGDRVVENQLTQRLGVSRPPLREALKVLEHEGLIVQRPRRGAFVTPLTQHDVYEIVTLRTELERIAVRLGVPVLSARSFTRLHDALKSLEAAADNDDEAGVTEHGFEFHLAVIGLAEHHRLELMYRSLALQLQLCMAMNRSARRDHETLAGNVERHRRLLEVIEGGDPDAVLGELAQHGHQAFLTKVVDRLDGASARSQAWLDALR